MNFYSNRLLGWLMSWLCPMLMFAAGSSAIAGAGEGEGGGAGAGEFEGGGGEGEDFEGGEGSEFEGGGEGEEDLDLGDGGERNQQTAAQRQAAAQERALPADVRKLIADMKASNDPKQIKMAETIRKSVFASQAWGRVFPQGIRQAREMRQAFEEVGGADGIRAIQEEKQGLSDELQSIDSSWERGDPEFIQGLAEENPEAFAKAAPVVLENWRKVDQAGYNYTTARIFQNTMASHGLFNVLSQLWGLADANKAQPGMAGILAGLEKFAEFTEMIRELASNQPALRADAGLKKLKDREKEFEDSRFKAFKQDVHRQNLRNLESALTLHLGKFLKVKNIDFRGLQTRDPETFKAMLREAESRLTDQLAKDRGFQQQKDRLLQSRDERGVLRLYQQKFAYLLADAAGPKIARQVANIFFRGKVNSTTETRRRGGDQNRGGADRNRGNGNNGGGGDNKTVVRVSSRPEPGQIDYSRTTDSMIMDGRCYLRGKKEIHAWR